MSRAQERLAKWFRKEIMPASNGFNNMRRGPSMPAVEKIVTRQYKHRAQSNQRTGIEFRKSYQKHKCRPEHQCDVPGRHLLASPAASPDGGLANGTTFSARIFLH